jgi:hypothetical protein
VQNKSYARRKEKNCTTRADFYSDSSVPFRQLVCTLFSFSLDARSISDNIVNIYGGGELISDP